jgi:UDP-N-acetylmuramyl pentapeptide phosphotransferase/UDP-N-acetylglucosamine-1-phosphate transferase
LLIAALVVGAFIAAYLGVGIFIRAAPKLGALDVPNERSSHNTPTPRGGGIVVAFVIVLFFSGGLFIETGSFYLGLIASASVIAIVGWLDDLYSIPLLPRLAVHILIAIFIVFSYGGFNGFRVPLYDFALYFGSFSPIISVFWIVLMINAYNFIDGIDGMAALQGVLAGFGWLLIGINYEMTALAGFGGILAASYLAFLSYNWHPAKVFMGDAGSSFLGFSLAMIPIMFSHDLPTQSHNIVTSSFFLSWPVLFDTFITRAWRIFRRTRFWEPNRDHFYQRMVIAGWKQSTVSTFYGIILLGILLALYLYLRYDGIYGFWLIAFLIALPGVLIAWIVKKRLT